MRRFWKSILDRLQFLRHQLPKRVRIYLAACVALMLVGHWQIIASQAIFNPQTGERYNLVTRWVSDFAAKWPEGLWVKAAIVFFCLGLAGFFGLVSEKYSRDRRSSIVWWRILATGMIGGLLLVILYDMSPPQYALKKASFLGRLFLLQRDKWILLPDGQIVWERRWYHQLGFRLFVVSYFATAISLTVTQWRATNGSRSWVNGLLLLLVVVAALWLVADPTYHAGVSQRVLLTLIFLWLVRNLETLKDPPLR